MKLVYYTVLCGDYDDPPQVVTEPGVDYVLFTDSTRLKMPEPWKVISYCPDRSPRRFSRLFKINPHTYLPGYDFWIYGDANINLKQPLSPLVSKYRHWMLTGCHHPGRDCLYDEARQCRELGLDNAATINAQVDRYQHTGFPAKFGLLENGFLIRRNCPEVVRLNRLWWHEYVNGSQRDQLSLMFCLWLLQIEFDYLDHYSRDNPYYGYRKGVMGTGPDDICGHRKSRVEVKT